MVRKSFMLIAGETSGDLLAAELVHALRTKLTDQEATPSTDLQPLHASLEPEFFGAGGAHMAEAGVKLYMDLTQHAVVGLWEVIKKVPQFRGIFRDLVNLAIRCQPDVIVCVDFAGFNLRFAQAIRHYTRSLAGTFANWNPMLVQYVSPQVWASRPERAQDLARNVDLLLSILPFEQDWYAERAPKLPVVFVGHSILDRHRKLKEPGSSLQLEAGNSGDVPIVSSRQGPPATMEFGLKEASVNSPAPNIVLLPGSRTGELRGHLPVLLAAFGLMQSQQPRLHAKMVLPNETLTQLARTFALPRNLTIETGGVEQALARADIAIASTGTVTLECAYFGVPTVALYRTSWATYWIGKQLVQVKYLAMPNILAGEEIFPEFIQYDATPPNIARAALELLNNPAQRKAIQSKLAELIASLGSPGASDRAAAAIVDRLGHIGRPLRAALTPSRSAG